MVYLPNEIINLILSFREINPVSLLIKDSVEKYHKKKYPYYFVSLWLHNNRIFYWAYERLRIYYEKKDKKLTIKKRLKGIKFIRNESIIQERKKDVSAISEKHETKIIGMRNRYNELYNLNDSDSD
jgi:hypothetical protein